LSWIVEAIGIMSGLLIYGAAIFKNIIVIKIFLLAGAIGFLTYGILLALPAIIIINTIGFCVSVYGLIRAIKLVRKSGI